MSFNYSSILTINVNIYIYMYNMCVPFNLKFSEDLIANDDEE